ncbi:MAG: hypothetical protein M0024_00385 [Nitrospiraceae bacterium]|nr:hypothetical protein [Nitrospiraceae bacterium]
MAKRKGVYLVKTYTWYLERLVWLVAGTDVLLSTLLAAFHSPYWAYSILFVGLCSIMVALTGFCIVGNLLRLFGARPMIPMEVESGAAWRRSLYFMQTDHWYLERYIYMFVGVNLSISSLLSVCYNPKWLYFTGFVGTATLTFAFTGFCIMANILYRLGAEPRLCRYI